MANHWMKCDKCGCEYLGFRKDGDACGDTSHPDNRGIPCKGICHSIDKTKDKPDRPAVVEVPVESPEVRAAAERLIKMRQDSCDHDGGYPATPEGRLQSCIDHATLAEAYLALRAGREDDGEKVTEEWLDKIGWDNNDYDSGWESPMSGFDVCLHIHSRSMFICHGREGEIGYQYFRIADRNGLTRDHVRRLCAALGIPLSGEGE